MFIATGILSILAGIFVFRQGTVLTILSGLASSDAATAVSGAFLIVALCLMIAGTLSCACGSGRKRGFVKASAVFYAIGSLAAFANGTGDLRFWSWVCLIPAALYIVWLSRHKQAENDQSQ